MWFLSVFLLRIVFKSIFLTVDNVLFCCNFVYTHVTIFMNTTNLKLIFPLLFNIQINVFCTKKIQNVFYLTQSKTNISWYKPMFEFCWKYFYNKTCKINLNLDAKFYNLLLILVKNEITKLPCAHCHLKLL